MKRTDKFLRKYFCLIAISTLAPLALAQHQLAFTPYHASGIYAVNEVVGWRVNATPEARQQRFTYTIKENNDRLLRVGSVDLTQGPAKIEVAVHEPAMIMVRIEPDRGVTAMTGTESAAAQHSAKGGPTKPEAVLGATVAPEQLQPVVPPPADFDTFWQGKLRELDKIPAAPELTPVPNNTNGVELYTVKLGSVNSHVQGYLAKAARPGKFPALVVYQWAGVYKLPPQESVERAEEGWLTLDVDSHDLPPTADTGVPSDYHEIGDKDRETSYFLNMYLRDTRALQYIQSRPDWDGKTLVIMGTSMGGQQSLVTAGLNPGHITAVVVNEPSGADTNGALHDRQTGYPYWNSLDPAIMKTALYFDPVNFAPHITAPTIIGVGFLDTTAPPAGLFTVYNQLAGPKEIVPMPYSAHNNLTPNKQGVFLARENQVLDAALRGAPIELKPLSLYASGQAGEAAAAPHHNEPSPGDAPENPGTLANNISGAMHPDAVKAAMRKVADWQLARVKDSFSQDWTYATLYLGMLAASDTLQDARYRDYVHGVAEHYDWTLGPRNVHADDQAIGQSYLWLNSREHDPKEIAPLHTQFDDVMKIPDDPQHPVWWWCDALFMAPPVWTQLAAVTGDNAYLDYMDREWHITSDLLWDPQEHLFFRDKSYFDKREKNGQKVFWSRGNGWVMGGLVRVLTFLPKDDPRRPFYVEKFRAMAQKIRTLQGADGLWRPGLLNAADYPYPEVSGSSFFVYATAWGIRNGILDRRTYLPVVKRGWGGLVAHIYADGRLGSIQPIGAAPGAYTPSSSYVFGTGAFLLAGSEVKQLAR